MKLVIEKLMGLKESTSYDDMVMLKRKLEEKGIKVSLHEAPNKVVYWLRIPIDKKDEIEHYLVSSSISGFVIHRETVQGTSILYKSGLSFDEVISEILLFK